MVAKHEDYYHLFPYCAECHRLRLSMNRVENYQQEELAERAYSRHLMEDHKITREEAGMLSVRRIAEIIQGFGYPALPSGCAFYSQDNGRNNMVIVPYPGTMFPSIFYLREREDSGIVECFRAIKPVDLLEDRSLACPEGI